MIQVKTPTLYEICVQLLRIAVIFASFVCLTPKAYSREVIWIRADEPETIRPNAVFDTEILHRKSINTLAKLLSEVSGGYSPSINNQGQFQSYFVQGAKSEQLLVLLDGVPINDLSSPSAGFDFSSLDISLFERIEIFKGPQTVRYGSQAFAGVILLITKKPNTERVGRISTGLSTNKTFDLKGTAWSDLTGTSKALVSIAGAEGAPGSAASSSDNNTEIDTYKKWDALVSLISETSDTSYRFSEIHTESSNDYDAFGGPNGDDPNAKSSAKLWVSVGNYQHMITASQNFQIKIYDEHALRYENDAADTLHASFLQSKFKSNLFGLESVYTWDRSTFGLALSEEGLDTNSLGSFSNEIRKDSRQKVSGFFQSLWLPFSELELRPGLRYECSKGNCRFQKELEFDLQKLYLKASKASREPSFYQLYSAYGDPHLADEKIESLALGQEKNLGSLGQMSFEVFRNQYLELIDFDNIGNKFVNRGKVSTYGGDVNINFSALIWQRDSENSLSVSYLEARDDFTDLRLLRRPTWVSSFRTLIHFSDRVEAGPQFFYRSSTEDVDSTGARVRLKSALRTHLFARYILNNTSELQIQFRNVFNNQTSDIWGYSPEQRQVAIDLSVQL